ncbi:hypothetical protein FACS18949_07820 [Clostridia bacterium]|nr:hypothetical protein FACS18949_07820 [Clostridia bacterium]
MTGKNSNKGSGMIAVIITVTMVALLGAAMLFMSYMEVSIKSADRSTRADFYKTEEQLDIVRATLQSMVSQAVMDAYTEVLSNYLAVISDADKAQEVFAEKFVNNLGVAAGEIVVAGNRFAVTQDGDRLVLRNISVNSDLNTSNGWYNEIYTSFAIAIPPFEPLTSGVRNNIEGNIIIADNGLFVNGGSSNLNGDIYAGGISVLSGGNLTITGGNVVSGRDILVKNSSSLDINVGGSYNIWANRIQVGGDFVVGDHRETGNLTINGNTFVADDLELAGDNASAVLTGEYFGFGSSLTLGKESSSIIVSGSGTNTSLNLQALTELRLAGRSFITSKTDGEADIPMGGSITVRRDQVAYLAPDFLLSDKGANPRVIAASAAADALTIDVDADLWLVTRGAKTGINMTLKDYGVNPAPTIVTKAIDANWKAVYYFMTFDTAAHRSEFFKDYFGQHTAAVQQYLSFYVPIYELPAGGTISVADLYYSPDASDGNKLKPKDGNPAATSGATMYNTRWENLKKTADESPNRSMFSAAEWDTMTPYSYYVIGEPGATTEFKDSAGNVKAVFSVGDYAIGTSTPDTVRVVISTGDVTVTGGTTFRGLIIAKGTVTLVDSTVTNMEAGGSRVDLAPAFEAAAGGDTLSKYTRNFRFNEISGGDIPGQNWNMNSLVKFYDWTKNEEPTP